jgi:hypothetical protein
MPRYLEVTLFSALYFVACSPRPTPATAPAPNHFSLVLEHSAQGWRASCEVGCRWRELTMSCGGCEVRITSVGVGPASSSEAEEATFAFTLTDAGSGWHAKSLRGVHWIALTWGCPETTCRARIDEAGVRETNL